VVCAWILSNVFLFLLLKTCLWWFVMNLLLVASVSVIYVQFDTVSLSEPLPESNADCSVMEFQRCSVWLVQRHLLKMGAKLFDPFNISVLLSVPKLECRVLVHAQDLPVVRQVPNLLRLKRHLGVTFLTFDNLKQVQSNTPSVIFPQAGVIVMDLPSLVSSKSGKWLLVSWIVRGYHTAVFISARISS